VKPTVTASTSTEAAEVPAATVTVSTTPATTAEPSTTAEAATTTESAATTESGVNPGAVAVAGAAAASAQEEDESDTPWGWIVAAILGVALVAVLLVWWLRSRAGKGNSPEAGEAPESIDV
jgi:hypothetical protein